MRDAICLAMAIVLCCLGTEAWGQDGNRSGELDVWSPLPSTHGKGLLGQRMALWRQERLRSVADDGYLLSGYESRPGVHPWQGEHVGKWLHAATLAYEETGDETLATTLRQTVKRLVAAQEANGYLGTYDVPRRFYSVPEDKKSWDVWSHRYNLYGLLTYERFHPDDRVLTACTRMADLLIGTFGEGKFDVTQNGTRCGISSTTLLESIMMLYERTQEERFLTFARHIAACSEKNSDLRLMGAMLEGKDVSGPGDGKAYQLMANLIGYLLLYKHTGDQRYLKTAENGWDNIRKDHVYSTGGPWGRKMPYNGNRECFALPSDFDPAEAHVETCSTTTWIQLNLHLLETTGQARYAAEAERAVFNGLLAAQFPEGIKWCYYTRANQDHQPFEERISCCASSGPRALEMFSHYLVGETEDGIAFTSLAPCSVALPDSFGNAKITVTGDFPVSPGVEIAFDYADGKPFAIEFGVPLGARIKSVRMISDRVNPNKNDRGFYAVHRPWKTGDTIAIEFDFLLGHHARTAKGGEKWIAFTYGPWALARKIAKGSPVDEPFRGKDLTPESALGLLEPVTAKQGALPSVRIKDSNITLIPYFLTGSLETGPRTYFALE